MSASDRQAGNDEEQWTHIAGPPGEICLTWQSIILLSCYLNAEIAPYVSVIRARTRLFTLNSSSYFNLRHNWGNWSGKIGSPSTMLYIGLGIRKTLSRRGRSLPQSTCIGHKWCLVRPRCGCGWANLPARFCYMMYSHDIWQGVTPFIDFWFPRTKEWSSL
jgi:hypothetical protein